MYYSAPLCLLAALFVPFSVVALVRSWRTSSIATPSWKLAALVFAHVLLAALIWRVSRSLNWSTSCPDSMDVGFCIREMAESSKVVASVFVFAAVPFAVSLVIALSALIVRSRRRSRMASPFSMKEGFAWAAVALAFVAIGWGGFASRPYSSEQAMRLAADAYIAEVEDVHGEESKCRPLEGVIDLLGADEAKNRLSRFNEHVHRCATKNKMTDAHWLEFRACLARSLTSTADPKVAMLSYAACSPREDDSPESNPSGGM